MKREYVVYVEAINRFLDSSGRVEIRASCKGMDVRMTFSGDDESWREYTIDTPVKITADVSI